MEFLFDYGLFLAKTLTIVVAIGAIVVLVIASKSQGGHKAKLKVTDMSAERAEQLEELNALLASEQQLKAMKKEQKAKDKAAKKQAKSESQQQKNRLFVLDFD